MLINKVINDKFFKLIIVGFISYYFGLMILQYDVKIIALLGLAVFVIIYFIKIEYAFYFIIISRTFVEVYYTLEVGEDVRLTQLIGTLLVSLFLFYFVVVNRENIFNLGVNKIYACFLILSIPAIFLSESLIYGIGYWFRLFQGFLFFNITILIVTSAGNELFKKKITIICLCVIIAILYPYFLFFENYIQGNIILGTGKIDRYSEFAATYNHFSYFLFFVFPFCVLLRSATVKLKKTLLTIFIGVIIYTIFFLSFTRNIWIAFFVFLLTWNILKKKYLFISLIIGAAILMLMVNSVYRERLGDIYIVLSGGDFFKLDPMLFSGRVGTWQGNINHFFNHSTLMEKMFGNGFDIRYRVELPQTVKPMETHNNYIFLLMNTGIFGLIFYLLFLFRMFQESFRLLKRTKDIYLASIARIAICLLFGYVSISIVTHILLLLLAQYYFSIFLGFVIACNIIEKRRESLTLQGEVSKSIV